MKLLVVTQAVNTEDPILGFFVRWIEEFAKHTERIEVVCLTEGKHVLPTNVRVHSLGKPYSAKATKGVGKRLRYVWNFYGYIWRLRRDYDVVLVHMNPEYVILGGPLWRLWGKRVGFWYNHPHAGMRFRMAAFLSNKMFFTSPYAATAHFKKARQMPAGIDTELFTPRAVPQNRNAIYMQGRIMPSKRVGVALEALRFIREKIPATLTLVGPEDAVYGKELRTKFADLISAGAVVFAGPKRNSETPALYGAARVSLNLAAAGHFDKSVLESMAVGTPVVACSDVVQEEWRVKENDLRALANKIERLINLPETEYHKLGGKLRANVVARHSLAKLGEQLVHVLQK